jgi:hypothetical protein
MRVFAALFLFMLLGTIEALAQDTLVYLDGHRIIGQVEEVGVDVVRYRTASAGSSVLVVAEKRELASVVLRDGQRFNFSMPGKDAVASEEFMARKKAISVDFLAPSLNHFTVGYEHVIGTRASLTGKLGFIGLGDFSRVNNREKASGGLVKLGVKFILPPNRRRVPSARDAHPLAGWYLKPELMFSSWRSEQRYYFGPEQYEYGNLHHYSSLSLNAVVGRQVVLGQRFTFDLFGGLGYGIQWIDGAVDPNDYYRSDRKDYSYSHAFLGSSNPLTVSGGMMFGFAF